jgi:predicted HicB family RNase H-like nuclease
MARKSEGKTETLNLRVSPDFKKRLAEEAAKERRSVTNYLEATLMGLWEKADAAPSTRKREQ